MKPRALTLLVLLFSATLAWAQFPSRAITIIVPIPPGGAPDIAARVLGDKLGQALGQPVVVENRAGANGNIANELVAKAPADGHTIGLLADSQIAVNPHLYSKMPIDTLRDLAPIHTVAANQFVLAVSGAKRSALYPDLPTIGEFYPGFENSIWLGLFGPAGIPEATLSRLRSEIRRALELPEVKEKMNSAGGLDPYITTPEEFQALIRRDYAKYAKVVKDVGIKLD